MPSVQELLRPQCEVAKKIRSEDTKKAQDVLFGIRWYLDSKGQAK